MRDQKGNKDICYAILAMNDQRLTPEAKYFLIRLVYLYGDVLVSATVKDLVKDIGLSDVMICNVRTLLASLGYLQIVPVLDSAKDKKKSGRPRQVFMILPELIKQATEKYSDKKCLDDRCYDNHSALLGRLLFWPVGGDSLRSRNVKKAKKSEDDLSRRYTFTVATRILLSLLYIHADPCGVVRDIGLSRLARIAGITVDRLESQIEIIKAMGYLIDRTSGLTSKVLYGRAIGAFYMNVSEDDHRSSGSDHMLLLMETNVVSHYNRYFWAYRIYRDSIHNKQGYIFNVDGLLNHPDGLANFLNKRLGDNYLREYTREIDMSKRLTHLVGGIRKLLESDGLYSGQQDRFFNDVSDLFADYTSDDVFNWAKLFMPFKLWDFFSDRPISVFSKYLQYRLDQYSGMLLNVGWGQIGVDKLRVFDSVLNHIESGLFPSPLQSDHPETVRRSALVLFIYCISYQQALLIKSLILRVFRTSGQLGNSNLAGCSFTILPIQVEMNVPAGKLAICIRLGSESSLGRYYAVRFNHSKKDGIEIENYSCDDSPEKCLEMFQRFGYDLDVLQRITKMI